MPATSIQPSSLPSNTLSEFKRPPTIPGLSALGRYFRVASPEAKRPESPLLTVAEVCGMLRINRSTLYSLIHRRELATLKIGRRRLIRRVDVNAYIVRRYEEELL